MSRRSLRPVHVVQYVLWLAVTGVIKFIPRPLLILMADFLGWLAWRVLRLRRGVTEENLRTAFGTDMEDAARDRVGLECYQNLLLTFFEFLQPEPFFGGRPPMLPPEGREHYEALRKLPPIAVTGHIGNWEVIAGLAREHNVEVSALAKMLHNPLVNRAVLATRARRGLEIIPVSVSMKRAVDAVRRGRWLAIVGDQDARRHGVFVEFFGRPASTAPGPAFFALQLDLPIFPIFSVRHRDRRRSLQVIGLPAIEPDHTRPRDEEVHRLTQEHTRALESVIRRFPASYFWIHRRFKTQPRPVRAPQPPTEETRS